MRSNVEEMVRKNVARFVDNEVIPRATEVDMKGEYPHEWFQEMAKTGAFGIRYPQKKGGSGGNTTLFCIIEEELARGLMSLSACIGHMCLMGTEFLVRFGTEEMQKQFFLPAMRGEKIATLCMTEPEVGSDLGSVRTSAVKSGDGYIINGMKTWITNGPVADFYSVLCQTDPNPSDHRKRFKGLDFFFVPRDLPGVSVSKPFELLGTRTSKISEVYFSNVQVPAEYRLGPPGSGMSNLLSVLAEIRAHMVFQAIGLQRAAMADSIRYVHEREQFGRPVGDYQLMKAKISNMAVNLEASKLMAYQASRMIDAGKDGLKEATMAKYFAVEATCKAVDEATRIFGGYAFSSEYAVSRYFRDARFLLYGGGTHEILQTKISQWVGV